MTDEDKNQIVAMFSEFFRETGYEPPSKEFFDLSFRFIELQNKIINDPAFEGDKETGYEYFITIMFGKLSMDQKRFLIKELEKEV